MDYFDRFDICEAYEALEHDYNVGGVLEPRGRQVAAQLHRMGWRGSPISAGDSDRLGENARSVYDAYVERHNLQ